MCCFLLSLTGTYIYSVLAQDNPHTSMIGARGDCLLAITIDSEILCALANTRQVVGVWPFNCLRRYWCGEGVFGFEAGKRSPRGEGIFTFATSTQDEEIYSTLRKYIDKAKQASLTRDNKYSDGIRKDPMMVDARPKLPLPLETSTASPLVSSDEEKGATMDELSYAQIPAQDGLVGRPRSVSPYERRSSLHHTDVSAPNPMYMLKRTQTSRPRRVQQWVEQTEAATAQWPLREADNDPPLPQHIPHTQPRGSPTLAEEDMYSHTQHIMPAPFQKRASDHNIVEDSTYHTLIHDKCTPTMKIRKESQGREGGGGEDTGLYSMAYPPNVAVAEGRRLHTVAGPGDEYGTLDRKTMSSGGITSRLQSGLPLATVSRNQEEEVDEARMDDKGVDRTVMKLVMTASKGSAPTTPGTPRSGVGGGRSDLEDSMMDNLLYNTHANVLMETQALVAKEENDGSTMAVVVEKKNETESVDNGIDGNEGEISTMAVVEKKETESDGGIGSNENGKDVGNDLVDGAKEVTSDSEGRGIQREVSDSEGRGIQRDAKGYTKVDKSKKQKHFAKTELEDAPPIPPRLYEGAEEAIGIPPLSPVSPNAPITDIAVSDV